MIARWLNNDCNILIFDEPTRGIDVGAKAEIYQLMQQLTQQGISIIMISSNCRRSSACATACWCFAAAPSSPS